jgi:hypothetical protein
MGAVALTLAVVVMAAISLYLVGSMIRSIQNERRKSGVTRIWQNFGLSMGFCILFFVSWAAHGVVQWQEFTDEARTHNESVEAGDFLASFSKATLENWQSEFLQLFSFVVMSALLIHHGSAESKDSDDRMERKLERIEQRLKEIQGQT